MADNNTEIHCYCIHCDEITEHSVANDESKLLCATCHQPYLQTLTEEQGEKSDEAYKRFIEKRGVPSKEYKQLSKSAVSQSMGIMSNEYMRVYEDLKPMFPYIPLKSSNETFVRAEKKVGRNDKCQCGSGKKNKNCCNKK